MFQCCREAQETGLWCFYIITSQTKAEAHSSTDWLPQCGGQLRRCVCVPWTSVKNGVKIVCLLDKIPRPLGIAVIRCFIQGHAANRNPCCRRGYGIELLMWLRSLTDWMGHIVYMIFAMDRLGPQCGWRTAAPQRWVFQEGRELDQECRHCPAPRMVSRHLWDELFSILVNLWYHYRGGKCTICGYLWCPHIRSIFDFRPIYKRNSWSKDRIIYLWSTWKHPQASLVVSACWRSHHIFAVFHFRFAAGLTAQSAIGDIQTAAVWTSKLVGNGRVSQRLILECILKARKCRYTGRSWFFVFRYLVVYNCYAIWCHHVFYERKHISCHRKLTGLGLTDAFNWSQNFKSAQPIELVIVC